MIKQEYADEGGLAIRIEVKDGSMKIFKVDVQTDDITLVGTLSNWRWQRMFGDALKENNVQASLPSAVLTDDERRAVEAEALKNASYSSDPDNNVVRSNWRNGFKRGAEFLKHLQHQGKPEKPAYAAAGKCDPGWLGKVGDEDIKTISQHQVSPGGEK